LAQTYRFGQVEIRPAERQLLVEGRPAPLGARAFDVLIALIDRRDRVVTKNELFDLVWPGLVVEENNLHVQISTLRKVLGSQSVATIPGRGFRFTPQLEESRAPSCALPARNHNLPAQLNSFIGRQDELVELKKLLATSRLVTLTSPGGTGKTRLSLQVAYELLPEYPDGVWFVELAAVADGRRVAQAVASALAVKEDAGGRVEDALVRHIRDRHTLVILDNCEHVLQACADLAKLLLQSGPNVKILASSREAMRVAGEVSYSVPALAVPAPREEPASEELVKYDAVRLFVERARAAQPSFALTAQNGERVADICRCLDGIPLAIELAAVRVRGLSVEQIAARLSDCFQILTGGDKTALPRQRTLRASIDWSYDLLSIEERELFRRLAVFSGGWTLEAAEAVCAGGDVPTTEVMDLLSRLVEKSLVSLHAQDERYRLLETVRQYAYELLEASGEADAVRNRHLAFYEGLAERARVEIAGPTQGVWMSRLDHERNNLLSAHAWCEHAPDGARTGLNLARCVKLYWINRGLLGVGHGLFVEALRHPGAQQRDERRCRALFDVGQFGFYMGRYAEAQRYLEESLAIARELGDKARIAAALQPLGMVSLGQGHFGNARSHLEEALALAHDLGDKRNLAAAMYAIAQLYRTEGALDDAERLYERALALAREIDDQEVLAVGLLNLAMVSICRRSEEKAREMLLQVVAIAQAIGSQRVGLSGVEVAAGLAALCEDWESTARFFGAAEAHNGSTGLKRDPADEAFLSPLMEKCRGALAPAAFEAEEAKGRALAYDEVMTQARDWLSRSR
jgi:predicted ATPase/DNA-binding winged helix-turn-helix (wHTH) protein/Tfp pilus assembly protein PilF